MKKKRFKPLLLLIFLCFAFWLGQAKTSYAQENNALYLGVGLGVSSMPEEQEMEKAGLPFDFHGDFSVVRIGYTSYTAHKSFSIYNYNWDSILDTQALYAAWKTPLGGDDGGLYGLLGAGYYMSTLQLGNNISDQSTQDFGLVVGVGMAGDIAGVRIGGALIQHSATSVFNDINLAVGLLQLQVTVEVGIL